jgi:hypothetical protein
MCHAAMETEGAVQVVTSDGVVLDTLVILGEE